MSGWQSEQDGKTTVYSYSICAPKWAMELWDLEKENTDNEGRCRILTIPAGPQHKYFLYTKEQQTEFMENFCSKNHLKFLKYNEEGNYFLFEKTPDYWKDPYINDNMDSYNWKLRFSPSSYFYFREQERNANN